MIIMFEVLKTQRDSYLSIRQFGRRCDAHDCPRIWNHRRECRFWKNNVGLFTQRSSSFHSILTDIFSTRVLYKWKNHWGVILIKPKMKAMKLQICICSLTKMRRRLMPLEAVDWILQAKLDFHYTPATGHQGDSTLDHCNKQREKRESGEFVAAPFIIH
jgi:hypothetical protein